MHAHAKCLVHSTTTNNESKQKLMLSSPLSLPLSLALSLSLCLYVCLSHCISVSIFYPTIYHLSYLSIFLSFFTSLTLYLSIIYHIVYLYFFTFSVPLDRRWVATPAERVTQTHGQRAERREETHYIFQDLGQHIFLAC